MHFILVLPLLFATSFATSPFVSGDRMNFVVNTTMIGKAASVNKFYFNFTSHLGELIADYIPPSPMSIANTGTNVSIQFDLMNTTEGSALIFHCYKDCYATVWAVTTAKSYMVYSVWLNPAFNVDADFPHGFLLNQTNGSFAQLPKSFLFSSKHTVKANFNDSSLWLLQLVEISYPTWKVYARMNLTNITSIHPNIYSVSGSWDLNKFRRPAGPLLVLLGIKATNASFLSYYGFTAGLSTLDSRGTINSPRRNAIVIAEPSLSATFPSQVNQFDPITFTIQNGGVPKYWWLFAAQSPGSSVFNQAKGLYFLGCASQAIGSTTQKTGVYEWDWRTLPANVAWQSDRTPGGNFLPVGQYHMFLFYGVQFDNRNLFMDVMSAGKFNLNRILTVNKSVQMKTAVTIANMSQRVFESGKQTTLTLQITAIAKGLVGQWALLNDSTGNMTNVGKEITINVNTIRVLQTITVSIPQELRNLMNDTQARFSVGVRKCMYPIGGGLSTLINPVHLSVLMKTSVTPSPTSTNQLSSTSTNQTSSTSKNQTSPTSKSQPSSSKSSSRGLSGGAVAGIVIGCVAAVLLVGFCVFRSMGSSDDPLYQAMDDDDL